MTDVEPGSRRSTEPAAAAAVLALDLGGTRLRAGVVTAGGRVVGRRVAPNPRGNARQTLAACVALLAEARLEGAAAGLEPSALGVSAPGPLDVRRGVLYDPPNLDRSLWDFPLADALARATGLATTLDKDTNVAALAEGRFGNARGKRHYVYLTVSTGVGGAIVADGALLTGADGVAGELGHVVIDGAGPRCGCGGLGHLEAFSSGTGIAAQARAALLRGAANPDGALARAAARKGLGQLAGRDVAEAAEAGDPTAALIVERGREAFAAAAVIIVNVFNPERIVVGGGIAMAEGDRLLAPARDRVRDEAFRTAAARVEIVPAGLHDDVGLAGAVPLVALRLPAHAGGLQADPEATATVAGRLALASDADSGDHSSATSAEPRPAAISGRRERPGP